MQPTAIPLALGLAAALVLAAPPSALPAAELTLTDPGEGVVKVAVGDREFTEYRYGNDLQKPILYPVYGPGQVRMTRGWPMEEGLPNEKEDHPHHQSLWFTHGDVNGVDFWAGGENRGRVETRGEVRIEGDSLTADHAWVAPDGTVHCTDTTVIQFGADEERGVRTIDFTITLKAPADAPVTFGDTKEGTMGIRTHPLLRLNNKDPLPAGKAKNSEGDEGNDLWGKAAKWVDYSGEVDGKPVGIAIFDHPSNPRHPTTWHAREYGLVAANPFGLSDFEKKPKGTGDMEIAAGESVTFQYRFAFYGGTPEDFDAEKAFGQWAGGE
ncbi:hypothetical protein BH23VER1_BH23VER1_23670 [soil metagenome]